MAKLSIEGSLRPVLRDLRRVRKDVAPRASARAMNTIARKLERGAVGDTARSLNLPLGVVRWHHDVSGRRTTRKRLKRSSATKLRQFVGWQWGTRSGEPGRVSVISLPGRRQTRGGVKARGGTFIPSGFMTRSRKGGRPGVFKRTGKSRYPIEFQRVDMTSKADDEFTSRTRASGPAFRKEFRRQMRVMLKRKRVRR